MSLSDWDREARELKYEIKSVFGTSTKQAERRTKEILKRKAAILHYRSIFDKNISETHSLAANETFLSDRGRSLLHWARTFVEKIEQYYLERSQLLINLMWAKLIETRCFGTATTSQPSDEKLIKEIATYQGRLAKIQSELNYKLSHFGTIRKSLAERYASLVVAKSNRESATATYSEADLRKREATINQHLGLLDSYLMDSDTIDRNSLLQQITTEWRGLSSLRATIKAKPRSSASVKATPVKTVSYNDLFSAFDSQGLDSDL